MALLLSAFQAKPILAAKGKQIVRTTADLGLSATQIALDDEGAHFGEDLVTWAQLQKILKEDRKVFAVEKGELRAIQVFSETTSWVRSLCPTTGAPTVLVSGIPMHRIKDTDPLKDTAEKIRALGPVKGRVLDTATGAGYTAIMAAKTASEVVTIEIDPAAIELARFNPYAQELFSRPNITQIIGDSIEEVAKMPAGSFCGIIHDPPTLSLGGELYSEDFYRALHRLLSRGGRMFHYISDPDSHLGKKQWPGVMRRLAQAGFRKVERHSEAYGVVASA